MPPCPSCGAALESTYKFCIHCGTALTEDAGAIPAAIRPDHAAGARSKLDIPLVVGIALGAAGAALIVYVAIMLFAPR